MRLIHDGNEASWACDPFPLTSRIENKFKMLLGMTLYLVVRTFRSWTQLQDFPFDTSSDAVRNKSLLESNPTTLGLLSVRLKFRVPLGSGIIGLLKLRQSSLSSRT